MASYDSPSYLASQSVDIDIPLSTVTYTASGQVNTSTYYIALHRASRFLGAAFATQGVAVSSTPTINILQGTNTAGSVTVVNTVGSGASNPTIITTATWSDGEVAKVLVLHTGTASAAQVSSFGHLQLKVREQFE